MDDFRIRKFKCSIQNSTTFQDLTNIQSADIAFTNFLNTFNSLYDKCFPIITKTVTNKSLAKPWITDSLVEQIRYKNEQQDCQIRVGLTKKLTQIIRTD